MAMKRLAGLLQWFNRQMAVGSPRAALEMKTGWDNVDTQVTVASSQTQKTCNYNIIRELLL